MTPAAWSPDPLVLLGLLAAASAYARGLERLWRCAGRGAVVAPWQAGSFGLGLAMVAAALASPLDALAHGLFSAHMVQHLLLVLLAAPLLALGAPLVAMTHALGDGPRGQLRHLRPPVRVRRSRVAPLAAAVAVHVTVLWGWHLPATYTVALRHPAVHALEHATLLGSALALWGLLVGARGPVRRPSSLGAAAMFAVALPSVGLGAALTFAPVGLYPVYEAATAARGLDLLSDQQLGGAIMWAAGGIAYTVSGAGLFGWWLAQAERERPRSGRPAGGHPPSG